MKNITLVHNVKNVANGNQTFKKKRKVYKYLFKHVSNIIKYCENCPSL